VRAAISSSTLDSGRSTACIFTRYQPLFGVQARRNINNLFLTPFTISAQVIVVVHTERGDKIRIISARQPSRKERKTYEEIYEQES
jgi:hypothetical protein